MVTFQSIFSSFSVPDIKRAREFYGDTLGLHVKEDEMGLEVNIPGGGSVFIYASDKNKPADFTILNLKVESIDEAIGQMNKSGITFERYDNMPAPQDDKGVLRGKAAGQGPDIAWFKDPFGNILSIIEE